MVAAAVVSASALAGTTAGTKLLPFTASYSGKATVQVAEQVATITAAGAGKGTLLGAGKITGKGTGDTSQQPCVPFSGPGTITGVAGTKLLFTVVSGPSQGCGDEQGQVFSISGKAKITKGFGKLKKARGTLKFTGVYDRGAGTFSVKFKGSLTL